MYHSNDRYEGKHEIGDICFAARRLFSRWCANEFNYVKKTGEAALQTPVGDIYQLQ